MKQEGCRGKREAGEATDLLDSGVKSRGRHAGSVLSQDNERVTVLLWLQDIHTVGSCLVEELRAVARFVYVRGSGALSRLI